MVVVGVGGAWLYDRRLILEEGREGSIASSLVLPVIDTALLSPVRFRWLRTVTVAAIGVWLIADPGRGELRGVEVGPGSFERAECTRASSFCIFPIRPRICVSDADEG